jgi:hypothetical protein
MNDNWFVNVWKTGVFIFIIYLLVGAWKAFNE